MSKFLKLITACFVTAAFVWLFQFAITGLVKFTAQHNYKIGYAAGYEKGAVEGFDYAHKQCVEPLTPRTFYEYEERT